MELSRVAATYDDTADELVLDAPEAPAEYRSAPAAEPAPARESPARAIGGVHVVRTHVASVAWSRRARCGGRRQGRRGRHPALPGAPEQPVTGLRAAVRQERQAGNRDELPMRQAKMTAKPARARRFFSARRARRAVARVCSPVTGPCQCRRRRPMRRRAPRWKNGRRRVPCCRRRSRASPRTTADTGALLDAGRASIDLEDYRAALGFLVRAEQASPRDGAVKAALGSAMVHMENPTRALDYFGEAQLMGASERLFLSDRGSRATCSANRMRRSAITSWRCRSRPTTS